MTNEKRSEKKNEKKKCRVACKSQCSRTSFFSLSFHSKFISVFIRKFTEAAGFHSPAATALSAHSPPTHSPLDPHSMTHSAVEAAEQNGIVFLDEIDKVCRRGETSGADVSREGVQRDLLPLIEGCTVSTKFGMIKTDHILFIASGAFHLSKPSDLIPELQGRLPIRVELNALEVGDLERILTEPKASLTKQHCELMTTEGLQIEFTAEGIRRIAEIAVEVNESTENIGARRLHTILERLLEEISFEAADLGSKGESICIDKDFVEKNLGELASDEDLTRFIL